MTIAWSKDSRGCSYEGKERRPEKESPGRKIQCVSEMENEFVRPLVSL